MSAHLSPAAAAGPLDSLHLNRDLLGVVPYVPGKSIAEVQAEFGLAEVIKLASNENPCGPSPLAVEAARAALCDAHLYPGAAERRLRDRIARAIDPAWDASWIVTGNGATDVIRMLSLAFATGGDVLVPEITFPIYRTFATMFGARTRAVPMRADWAIDLAALAGTIDADTRLIYLCSPNNPTGLALPHGAVVEFLAAVPPHVVVVIDESYRDFVTGPDPLDACRVVSASRPVLALRSFSKAAGLANLRIGYAVGAPDLIAYLARAQLPFHLGSPACAAAQASLDDGQFRARSRALVVEEREFVREALAARGLQALPSQTNFVLALGLPAPAGEVVDALQRRGVIVRNMAPWGLARALRVSVGTRDHNVRFLAALDAVFAADLSAAAELGPGGR